MFENKKTLKRRRRSDRVQRGTPPASVPLGPKQRQLFSHLWTWPRDALCSPGSAGAAQRSGGEFLKLRETEAPGTTFRREGSAPQDAGPTGIKYDAGKPRMDLIPPEAERALAEVLTMGAEKYGPNNWRGVEPRRYEAALRRHLLAWKEGEVLDPESGLPHLSHVLCNAAFLVALENRNGPQDAPRPSLPGGPSDRRTIPPRRKCPTSCEAGRHLKKEILP